MEFQIDNYILPFMVKKIGIFLGGLLIAGAIYFFFFAGHRADMKENIHEGTDVAQVSPEVLQFHKQIYVADLHAILPYWISNDGPGTFF